MSRSSWLGGGVPAGRPTASRFRGATHTPSPPGCGAPDASGWRLAHAPTPRSTRTGSRWRRPPPTLTSRSPRPRRSAAAAPSGCSAASTATKPASTASTTPRPTPSGSGDCAAGNDWDSQQAAGVRRINSRAWLLAIVLLLFHAPVTDFLGRVAEAADLNLTIGGTATPGHPPQRGSGHQVAPPTSGSAAKAVQLAREQIGKPYVWGDEGPGRFDCSGLAWYAWAHAGLRWERMTARDEYT